MDQKTWSRLAEQGMAYIRLTALRVLGAEVHKIAYLYDQALERYPFVWAASRFPLDGMAGDLGQRVRFLQIYSQRPRDWRYRKSRTACAEAMVRSEHPLGTMSCALRLLGMHGAEAIQPLLEVIRHQPAWEDRAECAAWALGRLGRVAVPEIAQELRDASPRVRRHLAVALWYSGPQAAPAARWLARDGGEYALAALLAMEGKGSMAMIEARRGPLWLDQPTVQRLAEIAFSDGDRHYAAAALGCFGPAAQEGLPVLLHLLDDPRPAVRSNIAGGLSWGGRPDAVRLLFLLSQDKEAEVAGHARTALEAYGRAPGELGPELLKVLRQGGGLERRLAAQRLAQYGLPPESELAVLAALGDPDPEVNRALLEAVAQGAYVSPDYGLTVEELLREEGPHTLAAAKVLARLDHANPLWKRLLWHDSEAVALLAAESIGRSRLPLKHWNLGNRQFLELPSAVLARLLENLHPTVLRPETLLPMLERPEMGARLAAVMALRYLGDHSPKVLKALRQRLCDPSSAVAVLACRVLLQLGHPEHAWAMLRSPELRDQEVALGWIRQHGVPKVLCREYAAGRAYTPVVYGALREALTPKRLARLAAEATRFLQDRSDCTHLADLGAPALPVLDELLRHWTKGVRNVAMQAMAEIIRAQAPATLTWLASHAGSLVLDPEDSEPLFLALLEGFSGGAGFGNPVWLAVSRSEVAHTAMLGIEELARGIGHNPDFGKGLLDCLQHFEPEVRRYALQWIARVLPCDQWKPRGQSLEARLLLVSRKFYEGPLEPKVLQKAVELLGKVKRSSCGLLVPLEPAQLVGLLELVGVSELYDTVAQTLIFRYGGAMTPQVWRALLRLRASDYYPELVSCWPRLLVSLLQRGEDFGDLNQWNLPGMRLALQHHQPAIRQRALEYLDTQRPIWRKGLL